MPNSSMSSRDRLAAALDGRPVDRPPFSPFLAYVWEYFPPEVQAKGQPQFLKEIGADPLWRGAPCPVRAVPPPGMTTDVTKADGRTQTTYTTPVGVLRSVAVGSDIGRTEFLVEHPLKTVDDFKVQTWIEEHTRMEYDDAQAREHLASREGLSLGMLTPRCKSAFQWLIEHAVGTEEMAYALCDFPSVVEELLAVMVQRDLEAARLAARGPYDRWLTWEDSSTTNYSPRQYEKYIAAEIRQWCDILKSHGSRYYTHACGHLRDILPAMAATGIAGVESLSPPPTGNITLKSARERLGTGLAIIGGIEPVTFLNTPLDDLGDYVRQVVADAGEGPFVLANSDSCPPGVTVEKFARVAEVVRSLGR